MKILLLGDVCATESTAPYFEKEDVETLFGDTVRLFESCDFASVNLECAITQSENAIMKFGPNLKSPMATARTLKKLGVDICGLSNNHIFDFGIEGYVDTKKALAEAGIAESGFGENYEDSRKNFVLEKNGEKICFIYVCEHEYSYALPDRMGSRPFDEFDTLEDIRAAAEVNDKVIVLYHGAKEQCRYPSPRLVRAFRAMARAGADYVIGQHSHCVGSYEYYKGSHLLYGQGNFNFIKDFPAENMQECWHSCLAVVYDTYDGATEFIPIVNSTELCGCRLAQGRERDAILGEFAKRNAALADGSYLQGWEEFCQNSKETYFRVIANACTPESTDRNNAIFGHFLDCEAHTDVWRQLFPTYNSTNEK